MQQHKIEKLLIMKKGQKNESGLKEKYGKPIPEPRFLKLEQDPNFFLQTGSGSHELTKDVIVVVVEDPLVAVALHHVGAHPKGHTVLQIQNYQILFHLISGVPAGYPVYISGWTSPWYFH